MSIKLKNKFVITELGNERVAVQMDVDGEKNGIIVRLNNTAADIWKGLLEGVEPDQIAEKLVADYDGVDLATAQASVERIIEELRQKGMIEE